MPDEVLSLLLSESIHAVLVGVIVIQSIVIVVLWRKINELLRMLLEVRAITASVHALNMQQSDELRDIKTKQGTG